MLPDTDFSNRVVLVTGAAQGIGAAIARAFVEGGAAVFLADLDRDGVERTAEELDVESFGLAECVGTACGSGFSREWARNRG